jgi:hypothetical protein
LLSDFLTGAPGAPCGGVGGGGVAASPRRLPTKLFSLFFLLYLRPTYLPKLCFFHYVFRRFSVRGFQKQPTNIFAKSKKSMSKKNCKRIDKNFDASFFSRFQVLLSEKSSKTTKKYPKNRPKKTPGFPLALAPRASICNK